MKNVKQVSLDYLVVIYLITTGLLFLLTGVIYPLPIFPAIENSTWNLINTNLISSLILIFICIYVLIIYFTGLTLDDLGFNLAKKDLLLTVICLLGFWLIMEATKLSYLLLNGLNLNLDPIWQFGFLENFGRFIGHLFGNAAFEEVMFRSFFFTQLYFLINNLLEKPKISIGTSLLSSQILFSLLHYPIRIYNGDPINFNSFFILMLFGIALALIYLRTNNILLCIVVHTYLNFQFPLITTEYFNPSAYFFLSVLITVIFYPRLSDRKSLYDELTQVDT